MKWDTDWCEPKTEIWNVDHPQKITVSWYHCPSFDHKRTVFQTQLAVIKELWIVLKNPVDRMTRIILTVCGQNIFNCEISTIRQELLHCFPTMIKYDETHTSINILVKHLGCFPLVALWYHFVDISVNHPFSMELIGWKAKHVWWRAVVNHFFTYETHRVGIDPPSNEERNISLDQPYLWFNPLHQLGFVVFLYFFKILSGDIKNVSEVIWNGTSMTPNECFDGTYHGLILKNTSFGGGSTLECKYHNPAFPLHVAMYKVMDTKFRFDGGLGGLGISIE